jgi:hypothetical protein
MADPKATIWELLLPGTIMAECSNEQLLDEMLALRHFVFAPNKVANFFFCSKTQGPHL